MPSRYLTKLFGHSVKKVQKNIRFVIPAKAGIHHLHSRFKRVGLDLLNPVMDSRLRGNDDLSFLND
jgi:hypothetical protein